MLHVRWMETPEGRKTFEDDEYEIIYSNMKIAAEEFNKAADEMKISTDEGDDDGFELG